MCEVTRKNFNKKFPEIKASIEKAKFISIDLEFSALDPLQTPRLFDNNKSRYATLRMNLLHVVPLQVGITAFHFDNDTDDYFGDVFTFYTTPAAFGGLDKAFYFQASTTNFLCLHNFDFNKFAYLGIPYLNNEEEAMLRQKLKGEEYIGENCNLRCDFEDVVKMYVPIVAKWYNTCKTGDYLEIPDVKKYENYYEIMYFIHKHLRKRFTNLWTYENGGCFCVKKVTNEELAKLEKQCHLDQNLVNDLCGFKHVFNLLTSLRKPIVGHNILQDLMILVNNFQTTLPSSYQQFKVLTNQLFPTIFDTKTIYYQLRSSIPKEKLPDDVGLEGLFHYFRDDLGRHLTTDTMAIECNIDKKNFGNYHEAGWDSFCTGYIFLRMAYFNISKHYPKSKKFVTSEVISGLSEFKNRVNVIRGTVSYIRMDGEDPSSNRPPWLVVESVKNEPVDVRNLMSTLSSYGFVDIKKLTPRGNKVLVAIDSYRTLREITKTFKANPKFQVKQYSVLRHSPIARTLILSAMTISGTLLLWLTHKVMKK